MRKIKIFTAVALSLVIVFCFAGCKPYKEQAGIYELTVLERNGIDVLALVYEYYRLDIKPNGDCTESYKRVGKSADFKQTTVRFENGKMLEGAGADTTIFDYADDTLTWIYSETDSDGEIYQVKMVFTRTETT